MITAEDLRDLRTASGDYPETEALKAQFRTLRAERTPFFLASVELDRVFHWKLRSQYERQSALRAQTPDAVYRAVTEAVFKVVQPDAKYESTIRLALLTALPGVGVPVASAILALGEPDRYCVIDFRAWRVMFHQKRGAFGIKEYLRYRAEVARLSKELGWLVQEVDLAIWEYDRRAI